MGTATPRLSHNILNGNGKAGVLVQESAQPSLIGNTFNRNGEDFSAPPTFNRDQLNRENTFTPVASPTAKPAGTRAARK